MLDLVQCLEWLGLIWDSKQFILKVPERRINDTKDFRDIIQKNILKFERPYAVLIRRKNLSISLVTGIVTN